MQRPRRFAPKIASVTVLLLVFRNAKWIVSTHPNSGLDDPRQWIISLNSRIG